MIKVVIISQSAAIRAGLKALLSDDTGLEIVGEAFTPTELMSSINSDVVIWSPAWDFEGAEDFSVAEKFKNEASTSLLLIYSDPWVIEKLMNLTLRGWGLLAPDSTPTEILSAVHALNEGLVVVDPAWLKQILRNPTPRIKGENELIEPLTGREIEILQQLAMGLTNKQIALKLGISAHTVKFHISTIFSKMGTTNRTETVKSGLEQGLISI